MRVQMDASGMKKQVDKIFEEANKAASQEKTVEAAAAAFERVLSRNGIKMDAATRRELIQRQKAR